MKAVILMIPHGKNLQMVAGDQDLEYILTAELVANIEKNSTVILQNYNLKSQLKTWYLSSSIQYEAEEYQMKMKLLTNEVALLQLGIAPEFMRFNIFQISQENIQRV